MNKLKNCSSCTGCQSDIDIWATLSFLKWALEIFEMSLGDSLLLHLAELRPVEADLGK